MSHEFFDSALRNSAGLQRVTLCHNLPQFIQLVLTEQVWAEPSNKTAGVS